MEDRRYMFPISNGLLSAGHRDRMGTAIWEFLWCIDRITKEYETPDGDVHGLVLGGKPIQAAEIAEGLGMDEKQVRRNLQKLHTEGYILLKRTAYGQVIEVCKSKKFNKRTDINVQSGKDTKVRSPDTDRTETSDLMDINVRSGSDTNVHSNKTLQLDLPEDIKDKQQQLIGEIENQGIGGVPSPGPSEPERNTNPYKIRPEALPVRDHFYKRTGKPNLTHDDIKALNELLDKGISVETICLGIDYKVNEYPAKYPGDKIRSLKYCEGKIQELHFATLKVVQNVNQVNGPPIEYDDVGMPLNYVPKFERK